MALVLFGLLAEFSDWLREECANQLALAIGSLISVRDGKEPITAWLKRLQPVSVLLFECAIEDPVNCT